MENPAVGRWFIAGIQKVSLVPTGAGFCPSTVDVAHKRVIPLAE